MAPGDNGRGGPPSTRAPVTSGGRHLGGVVEELDWWMEFLRLAGRQGQGEEPDAELLASAGVEGTVRLWNSDGVPVAVLKHDEWVSAVAWSHDGDWLASGDGLGNLQLWRRDGTPGPRLDG